MDEKKLQALLYDPYVKKPWWHSFYDWRTQSFWTDRAGRKRRIMFADDGPHSYEMWLGVQYAHAMELSSKHLRWSDYLQVAEDLLMDGTAWDWETYDYALVVALQEHFPAHTIHRYFREYLEWLRDGMYRWD